MSMMRVSKKYVCSLCDKMLFLSITCHLTVLLRIHQYSTTDEHPINFQIVSFRVTTS